MMSELTCTRIDVGTAVMDSWFLAVFCCLRSLGTPLFDFANEHDSCAVKNFLVLAFPLFLLSPRILHIVHVEYVPRRWQYC